MNIDADEIAQFFEDKIQDEYIKVIESLREIKRIVRIASLFECTPYKLYRTDILKLAKEASSRGSMGSGDDITSREQLDQIIDDLSSGDKDLVDEMINKLNH